MSNPFTIVHDALWAMLESSSEFTDLVPVGNRIKFSGDNSDPLKSQAITTDYPEVRIVPAGGMAHIYRTSNSSSFNQSFAVQILSGDQRVDFLHFPLQWIVYRVFAKELLTLLALTFNSESFVKNIKPASVQSAYPSAEGQQIKGWVGIWACEVEMWFSTAGLNPIA